MFGRLIFPTLVLAAGAFAQTIEAPSHSRPMIINMNSGGQSYLGVGLGEVDSERARHLKLKEEYGVELTRVEEDSPASKAGLKSGDVVLEYNGQRVEGMEQFARFVRETPPGREVKLTISRDGNRQAVMVKVGQRKMSEQKWSMNMPPMPPTPPAPPSPPEMPRPFMVWQSPRMGIDSEAVEGQLAQFFGVKEGVLIRAVMKGSAAEKAGLRAGDVVTKVDGSTVTSPGDVTRAVRASRTKKTFPVTLMREKREMTVNVTIEEGDDHSGRGFFHLRNGSGYGFEIEPGVFEFHFEVPDRTIVM